LADLYVVKADHLNIRSSPQVEDDNRIASIPLNHVLSKLSAVEGDEWWKIRTIKDQKPVEGYVASRFLKPAPKRIQAIGWFKQQFRDQINPVISSTPFGLDLLAAIAMQETYYIWGNLYGTRSVVEVLRLCTGDTLDSPNRSAFPKNKAELLARDNGDKMFAIARESLEEVANFIPSFKRVADSSPNKFCRGYGIFQLDLQFFKENPDYFLQKKWNSFDECLAQCVNELTAAMRHAYGRGKAALTDEEKVYVAVAYNQGRVDLSKKFKQGFRDDSGKYYGEYIWDYLQLAKSVP